MREKKIEFFKRRLYADFDYYNMEITKQLLLSLMAVNAQYDTLVSQELKEAVRRIWKEQFHTDTFEVFTSDVM